MVQFITRNGHEFIFVLVVIGLRIDRRCFLNSNMGFFKNMVRKSVAQFTTVGIGKGLLLLQEFFFRRIFQFKRILHIRIKLFLILWNIVVACDIATSHQEITRRISREQVAVSIVELTQFRIAIHQAFHDVITLVHHHQDAGIQIRIMGFPFLSQFRIFSKSPRYQCCLWIEFVIQELTFSRLVRFSIFHEQGIVFLIDLFFIDASKESVLVADTVTAVQEKQRRQWNKSQEFCLHISS